jgi:nitrite reductase/ring-hydroxylating ferredoxin subunit
MWGGVTSAAQLRGITDVVDKFAIRVHGAAVTCSPLHNWVISLDTGEAQRADKGIVPTVPVRIEGGGLLLALAAAADRAA